MSRHSLSEHFRVHAAVLNLFDKSPPLDMQTCGGGASFDGATDRLNQQVRRNHQRFPADFLFQLTTEEFSALILQNARSKPGGGGRRKLPLAFTGWRHHGRYRLEQPSRR